MNLKNLRRRGMALVMLLALTAGLFVPAWAAESKAEAPELSMWDPTSVTVNAVEGQEYAIAPKGADPDWTKAAEPEDGFVTFEDLTPASAYVIYTRMKGETADPQTKELTLDLISIGVFSEKDYVPGAEIIGQIEPEDTQGLTYQWYYDSITENEEGAEVHDMTPIDGATDSTYTVKEADLGKYLAFKAFRDGVEVGCQDAIGPVSEEGVPALPGAEEDDVCPKDDTCPISRYTDAQADAWYHDGVHWALGNNVMNGVGNDKFAPGGTATRAMVVTMVWRLEGEPSASKAASFSDVSADAWYANAVAWASEVHAVNGTSDTTFSPDTPITREQLATILYRYAQAKGEGFVGSWYFLLDAPDADKISEYANEAMHWMVMNGIITGREGGMLAPQDNATRAEIATIFQRFCGTLGEAGLKPITPEPQKPDDQQPAEPEQAKPAEVTVDYGDSKLYTKEDMDAAIAVIRAMFDTWKGCELHSIRFAGDEANSADTIKWMNELKEAQKKEGPAYTQCIEFISDFHSPKDEADLKDTAWNPDEEYNGWQWYLARTDGGDWTLLTWGY